MTIANQLSAEIATALLVNRKGDPEELLNVVRTVYLELRRLSSEGHSSRRQQPGHFIATGSSNVAKRAQANC